MSEDFPIGLAIAATGAIRAPCTCVMREWSEGDQRHSEFIPSFQCARCGPWIRRAGGLPEDAENPAWVEATS